MPLKPQKYETDVVKEWLWRYQRIIDDLDNLYSRLEVLNEQKKAPRTATLDGMPHSGTKNIDPIGTIVSKIDEVNRTIENRNLQAQNVYREINDTIELLHGKAAHMWRVILQLRYLDHAGWNEINFGSCPKK